VLCVLVNACDERGKSKDVPNGPQDERPEERFLGASRQGKEASDGNHVNNGNVNEHGPVHVSLLVVVRDRLRNVAKHLR